MTVSIVACGDSAKDWHKVPVDLSIGVNDCLKWGHQVDQLLLINAPGNFRPRKEKNFEDRLSTIVKSRPEKVLTNSPDQWRRYFSKVETLELTRFHGVYVPGKVYYSKTSPFAAICYAVKLGAKDIILWGVDMVNHHRYRKGTKDGDFEVAEIMRLVRLLEERGVKVWRGNNDSVLNIPVWKNSAQ